MLDRILVPIDGSETALRAVDMASRIAVALGSEIYLLHVVDDGSDAVIPPGLEELAHMERLSRTGERHLMSVSEQILGRAAARAEALQVRSLSRLARPGRPGATIVAVAKEKGIDLIVMGRHGGGFVSNLLIGSITARVMQLSDRPCLTVT